MDIFDAISPDEIARFEPQIGAAPLLIADANLSEVRYTHTRTRTHTRTHTHTHTHTHTPGSNQNPGGTVLTSHLVCYARVNSGLASFGQAALLCLARLAAAHSTPLWLEPTSVPKAARACAWLHTAGLLDTLAFVSPNEDEAVAMAAALDGGTHTDGTGIGVATTGIGAAAAASALVRAGCRHVFVTRGARGVLWARDAGGGEVAIEEVAALALGQPLVSTRGAGDAFVAGAASRLLPPLGLLGRDGKVVAADATEVREALQAGLRAARLVLLEEAAVPSQLRHGGLE